MILFTLFKKSVIIRSKMNRLTKWYKIIQLIARKESKETDELDLQVELSDKHRGKCPVLREN